MISRSCFFAVALFCFVGRAASLESVAFLGEPVAGHAHAATVLATSNGVVVAWFEGSHEQRADCSIFVNRRVNGLWQGKRQLPRAHDAAHWNPVLLRGSDGRIVLFYKIGSRIADWQTWCVESRDEGESWTAPRELVAGDRSGGRGPVKNKCLRLKDGRILAPASVERGSWRAFADISDDDGRTWRKSAVMPVVSTNSGFGVIQPTFWIGRSGEVRALLRSNDGWLYRTHSSDRGESWSPVERTSIGCVNSGIDAVRAGNGRVFLVCNSAGRGWVPRNELRILVSEDDGETWQFFQTLARDEMWQPDGRLTEFAYPSVVEVASNRLAIVHTWNRRQIRYVELDVASKGVSDALSAAPLGDVRLGGHVGAKADEFIRNRITSDFAQREIFGEARAAFARRDDDKLQTVGFWQGEFWGKLMIGAARAAAYAKEGAVRDFVRDEARRMMALQDADGYLGSYAKKEFVVRPDDNGYRPASDAPHNWNLWCRKYAIWGMLEAARITGERDLLVSAARQMDQWIAMMDSMKGVSLLDTGFPRFCGLPTMSVLKPLLLLYRETGKSAYLEYARRLVAEWDRADGRAPNLIANALTDKPVAAWYPNPSWWAKGYEMLSCIEGLVEYVRVTGDRRVEAAVFRLYDKLAKQETNPLGGVGLNAMFMNAASALVGMGELCDTVHWIRLNCDLLRLTGDAKYADAAEVAFLNEFLSGIYRGGKWTAAGPRDQCRSMTHGGQCGMKYNHCCVDNAPRAFFALAESQVTRDASGALCVAFYTDFQGLVDGARVSVSGNYPVANRVRVLVEGSGERVISLRVPRWSRRMTVDGRGVRPRADGWHDSHVVLPHAFDVVFDMPPRLVESDLPPASYGENDPRVKRYTAWRTTGVGDLLKRLRTTPAARVCVGPLVLAKSVRLGGTGKTVFAEESVNGRGWTVSALPLLNSDVWGAWRLVFRRGDEVREIDACDYSSAADYPYRENDDAFSIWF